MICLFWGSYTTQCSGVLLALYSEATPSDAQGWVGDLLNHYSQLCSRLSLDSMVVGDVRKHVRKDVGMLGNKPWLMHARQKPYTSTMSSTKNNISFQSWFYIYFCCFSLWFLIIKNLNLLFKIPNMLLIPKREHAHFVPSVKGGNSDCLQPMKVSVILTENPKGREAKEGVRKPTICFLVVHRSFSEGFLAVCQTVSTR